MNRIPDNWLDAPLRQKPHRSRPDDHSAPSPRRSRKDHGRRPTRND
ncbi:hypothetical protein KUV89_18525 [Marinobacter hydrocarbonoclasticus]|nr:hypothetical protein [Marinobacter nauticus]